MAGTNPEDRSADAARSAALDASAILDTGPEPGFDNAVILANLICGKPVALVSFVADDRQWFKARVGFPACEMPLGQSVCAHVLRQGGTLVIPDLAHDSRTEDNALVTEEPFIRFYAGALLHARGGVPIGTLCVIDTEPRREGLTEAQRLGLEALARQVTAQLEARRLLVERAEATAERQAAEAAKQRQQELLTLELGHRLKNVLAVVQSIAARTLRDAASLDEARAALSDDLRAMGQVQDILLAGAVESASMAALVRTAAKLHGSGGEARFRIHGPEVEIGAKAVLMLMLALHELSTNAAKYGALSSATGSIDVEWSIAVGGAGPTVTLVWRESGGPAVKPKTRGGFGTRLIERALAATIGGTVALDFPPSGAVCRIEAPLAGFTRPGDIPALP